ncbi:MAG: HEAT repeat domain-containing protein [Polyangiaceae bacterium]
MAEQPATSAPAVASAEKALPMPSAEKALPSFERGLHASYTVKLTSEASLEASPLTQFMLSGSLELIALDAPARVLVQGSVRSPSLTTTLPGKAAEFKALEYGLTEPFLFELLPGNVLGEVWVQPNASVLVAGIQKTLAGYLQGGDRGEPVFLVEERDTTGAYEARYARAKAAGTLDKQKLRYLNVTTPGSDRTDTANLPKIELSELSLRFESTGRLASVKGNEQVLIGGMMGAIESKSSLELLRTSAVMLAHVPDYQALLTGLKPFASVAIARQDLSETDALRVSGRSLDQVLSALRAQGPEPTDASEKQAYGRVRADLFGALQGLIRTQPSTIGRFTPLITKADPLAPVLLDALSASGSADAQRALVVLIEQRKLDASAQKMVAISLSRSQHPTPNTTAALIRLLDDPTAGTQAMYGLGTCIRRLRADGETAHARRLLDVVLTRLKAADSTLPRVTALRALANAADEEAFPAVQSLLSSQDEEVRAAATESLQLVNLAQAETALAHALSDPSQGVRLAATRALQVHRPASPLLDAVSNTALRDDNAHVRMGAVRLLATWLAAHPELADVLTKVAESDVQPDLRQLAETTLAAHRPTAAVVH